MGVGRCFEPVTSPSFRVTSDCEREACMPGPNSKSISVLDKSKSKSYLVSQYWASLNTSLTSLASLNQDLDNNWKLIPKSNQFRMKFLNLKKNFTTCHDFFNSKICELRSTQINGMSETDVYIVVSSVNWKLSEFVNTMHCPDCNS